MCELSEINNDINTRRGEQIKIQEDIGLSILNTFKYYDITERNHFFRYSIKIDNYKLKLDGECFTLCIGRKCILEFKRRDINSYTNYELGVKVMHFDKSAILEMQDFNNKFVEVVKERLLNIKNKEDDEAIEMIALKSLV